MVLKQPEGHPHALQRLHDFDSPWLQPNPAVSRPVPALPRGCLFKGAQEPVGLHRYGPEIPVGGGVPATSKPRDSRCRWPHQSRVSEPTCGPEEIPSSVSDTRRFMERIYDDAMGVVARFRKLDLFITFKTALFRATKLYELFVDSMPIKVFIKMMIC